MKWIVGALVLGGVAFVAPETHAQESGAFVVRLGADTISADRYTRTATRLEGEQVVRSGRTTTLRRYVATLGPDGSILSLDLTARPAAGGGGPAQRSFAVFGADSAFIVLVTGDSSRTLRVRSSPGAIAVLNQCYGLYEQLTRRARTLNVDSFSVVGAFLGQNQPLDISVRRRGGDSLVANFGAGSPTHFRADDQGRILWATGRGSTQQVDVERVASLDFAALTAAFAARPLGTLSPRDTVRAAVGGSALWVDYGRPSKRGRAIFGQVVPWETVWRTGANAATQFHTDADLLIGGKTIPAGTYTLWTLPSPREWLLIINKNTGQWGTEYDAQYDLERVPLRVERLRQPVEQFTFSIEAQGNRGTLRYVWDDTQASIAFRKK